MIPFHWRSDQPIEPIIEISARAGDIEALRPTPTIELAAYLDQSLSHFLNDFTSSVTAAASVVFGSLSRDENPAAFDGLSMAIDRSLLTRVAQTQRPDAPVESMVLVTVPNLEFQIVVAELVLEGGSLWTKILCGLVGSGFGTAIVLAWMAPTIEDWHRDRLAKQEIVRITQEGRCGLNFSGDLQIDAMRRLGSEALLRKNAITPVQTARRACLVQVLLHLNGAYPGKFDGIEGPLTRQAELEFAKSKGLPKSAIDTIPFYEALLAGVQPSFRS